MEIIREVIKRLFQVSMSGVSVWRTLKALGLSAQRPRHEAYQQNEEAVKALWYNQF
ncbi:MAG: winged helix-turn-helix domain-containing protein [Treponema sp.]|nr:winged helix-turn-helix domain-containing protein [Treponema sp.]